MAPTAPLPSGSAGPPQPPKKTLPPLRIAPPRTGFEISDLSPQSTSPPKQSESTQITSLQDNASQFPSDSADIFGKGPPNLNTANTHRPVKSREQETPKSANLFANMLSPLFSPMGGGRGTGSRPPASTPIATKLEIAEAQDKTPPINPYVEKLYMWFTETVCAVYQGVDYSVPPSILSSNPDIRGSKDSFDHWMKSPLSSKSAAESNDSLLHDINFNLGSEYMTPFLKFKIPELEKEYQYNILLPTKVVHLRLGSAALGLYSIGYLVWYCAQHGVQGEIWRYITIASICILCISCFVVSTWQNGKMIVVLPSESFAWRVTLTLIKILTWCSTLCYDFLNTTNPTDSLGSAANLVIYCLFFTTGLSGTFLDRIYSFLCVVAIVVVKAMLISSTGSWVGVAIYLLPLLTTCLLSIDEIYTGDKDRRMRHLNTKIVQSRLKGLKGESQKTEYLLSLTLPPMIVTKLKEVGTANFDLIAERFDLTSVMFTDIKNYKEVAQSISTRHGVNLLNTIFHHMDNVRNEFKNLERIKTINSKMLIVGGLDKQDDVDHLVELIDMALIYRDMFQQEVSCSSDSKGQTILSAKLQIGMGISIGPLVAGIVGKKTFCYEVYGDVVNTASRMLSIAKEGQIIVTSQVWELIKTEYMGTYIGEREVKGKGLMKVYCIDKMRNAADMPESIPSSTSSSRKQSNRTSFLNKNRRKSSAITPIKGRHIDTEIFQSIILSGNSNRLSEESLVNSLSNLSLKQKVAQGSVISAKAKSDATTLNSIQESLESLPKRAKTRKSVAFQIDDYDAQSAKSEAVVIISESPAFMNDTHVRNSLGLTPLDSTSERRWSQLIFPEPPAVSRRPSTSMRANSKVSPDDVAVTETEDIIRRISTVRSSISKKKRMSIDSAAWANEDQPLSLEAMVKKQLKTESEIEEEEHSDSGGNKSSNPQEDIKQIKQRISSTFRDKKAKYALYLTTLALVGGYKEELTNEEHGILEHTGTQNFLMSDMCMDVIQNSLTPDIEFISKDLERRYILDSNDKHSQKFWNFSVKGILCEMIITAIAIFSMYFHSNSSLSQDGVAVLVITIIFICTGSQVFIAAVTTIPTRSKLEPTAVLLLGIWSAITLTGIVTLASSSWSGLTDYQLLVPVILPLFPIVHTFMLEGISFRSKILISLMLGIFFLFYNYKTYVSFAPLLSIILFAAIFSPKEITVKSEYLMELIATTQANLVKEESEKSAHVLTTILPKRIIIRLLADPNTMFYEEFAIATVLHMDIAGFTAMSAKLEPLDIVKIFNNLFSHFDHLTQDFHLEKITTIGDAYVASSNLSNASTADPRTSAISVCIVALQMQSFVVNQVNQSFLMKRKHHQSIQMRIGINSGPCCGAIMGGEKNFRYDLMGDTVTYAEKIQEHCEIATVFISETTYDMVKNYHAFKFELTNVVVNGQKVYLLSSDH